MSFGQNIFCVFLSDIAFHVRRHDESVIGSQVDKCQLFATGSSDRAKVGGHTAFNRMRIGVQLSIAKWTQL